MTCALTHDDPVNDCDAGGFRLLTGILIAAVVLSIVLLVLYILRRRRGVAVR